MCKIIFSFLCLVFGFLFADSDDFLLPHVKTELTNFESEPSAVVGNVNVITGDCIDFDQDMSVLGPVPLHVERSRDGSGIGVLGGGWNHNWLGELFYHKKRASEHRHMHYNLTYYGPHGEKLKFDSRSSDARLVNIPVGLMHYQKGLTNCGSGEISGKTNLRNYSIVLDKDEKKCFVNKANGSKLCFKKVGKNKYLIEKEILPNLNQISYEYETVKAEFGEKNERIKKVITRNRKGDPLTWIEFQYSSDYRKDPHDRVITSDDRVLSYSFRGTQEKGSDSKPFWNMAHIYRPEKPLVTFHSVKNMGNHKRSGYQMKFNDSFIITECYDKGEYTLPDGTQLKIKHENDFRVGKVYRIYAPLGTDSAPHVQYSFVYEEHVTHVWDAHKHKTTYAHENMRLKTIERFDKDNTTRHTLEEFIWGPEDSDLNCNLMSRSIRDKNNHLLFERQYIYDSHHNVAQEILIGNICGKGEHDKLIKNSTYSDDGMNLLLTQTEGEITNEFTYYPKTNLIRSHIKRGKDGHQIRKFYDYDDSAVMTLEITDNGQGKTRNDLGGVTQRTFQRIEPTKLGLPGWVIHSYLDEHGNECVLHKEVNKFNKVGKLIHQEVYDAQNQLSHTLEWRYDARGNLVHEKNALGQVTRREYDINNNLISETVGSHFVKTWKYDLMNRVTSLHETDGNLSFSTHFSYNKLGYLDSETDSRGHRTRFIYDCHGNQAAIIQPGNIVQRKKYGLLGRIVQEIDGNKNATKYHNTMGGQVHLKEFPDGSIETTEYNLQSLPVKKTERNGLVTEYTYDSFGRIVSEVVGGRASKTFRYDAFNLLEETDPSGLVTSYSYDRAGRKIALTRGEYFEKFDYDNLGRLFRTTTPSKVLVKGYDLLDRLEEEKTFDLNEQLISHAKYAYDLFGNQTHSYIFSDEGVSVEEKSYNAWGDLQYTKDALGNLTKYIYHYKFRNVETIDPLGRCTTVTEDILGRVASLEKKNSLGTILHQVDYAYDSNGNKIQTVEKVFSEGQPLREVIHAWSWDSMNQLTSVTEGLGTPEQKVIRHFYNCYGQKESTLKPDGQRISYRYDLFGRLASMEGPSLAYEYTYDSMDRCIKVDDLVSSTSTERIYSPSHDLIQEKLANHLILNYSYDSEGRLLSLKLPQGGAVHYHYQGPHLMEVCRLDDDQHELYRASYKRYDLSGRLRELSLPYGLNVKYEYDALHRLVSQEGPIGKDSLSYDPVGHLTQVNSQSFTYDDLDQLASEKGEVSHHYHHDSLYNLINKDGKIILYNALNQPLDVAYDLNGNLVSKDGMNFRYDLLDRLIEVNNQGNITTYTYDPFNRQVTFNSKNFLYQGDIEIGLFENGEMKELRVLGEGISQDVGSAIAFEIEKNVIVPLHDYRGNVVALFDTEGKQAASFAYTAFGELVNSQKTSCPWLFSSKRYDQETGFYSFGRRHYDPETHRWITPDPILFEDGPNLYAYAHNNPLTSIDPEGLWAQDLMEGFTRGAIDDTTWGLSNLSLGEYKYTSLSSQLGYYAGTGTSLAAGLWYGNTEAKILCNAGKFVAQHGFQTAKFTSETASTAFRFTESTFSSTKSFISSTFREINAAVTPSISRVTNVFKESLGLKNNAKNTYAVYQGIDASGLVRYVGITSRPPLKRFSEHLKSLGTGKEFLRFRLLREATNLTSKQARVLEQGLINQHGLRKNGGSLLNKRNSISPRYWEKYGIE